MADYFGDFAEDQTVYIPFSTSDSDGAGIARATDGTIRVYKDDGTTEYTSDITDSDSFDSHDGINMLKIETTNAWYTVGHDYTVVLDGATIDGVADVNVVIGTFSIENRAGPEADEVAYTPDDSDDWSTVPDDAAEGLDVLAANVALLLDEVFPFDILTFTDNISSTQLIGLSTDTWKGIGGITFSATYDNDPDGMTAEVGPKRLECGVVKCLEYDTGRGAGSNDGGDEVPVGGRWRNHVHALAELQWRYQGHWHHVYEYRAAR